MSGGIGLESAMTETPRRVDCLHRNTVDREKERCLPHSDEQVRGNWCRVLSTGHQPRLNSRLSDCDTRLPDESHKDGSEQPHQHASMRQPGAPASHGAQRLERLLRKARKEGLLTTYLVGKGTKRRMAFHWLRCLSLARLHVELNTPSSTRAARHRSKNRSVNTAAG